MKQDSPDASVWAQVQALWVGLGKEVGSWAVQSDWRWGYVGWSCTGPPLVLSLGQKCLTVARSHWYWLPGQPSPPLGSIASCLCPPLHPSPRPGWDQACWPAALTPGNEGNLCIYGTTLTVFGLFKWPVDTLLYSFRIMHSNLYGLGPLHQIASHEGVGEDSAKSSGHTERHMEEAQQHRPVEGHQGGHHVRHRHVLYLLHLLLQTLHGQNLKKRERVQVNWLFTGTWLLAV